MIVGSLDFDNTIISYEKIFYNIAYKKKLIPKHISKIKTQSKNILLQKARR